MDNGFVDPDHIDCWSSAALPSAPPPARSATRSTTQHERRRPGRTQSGRGPACKCARRAAAAAPERRHGRHDRTRCASSSCRRGAPSFTRPTFMSCSETLSSRSASLLLPSMSEESSQDVPSRWNRLRPLQVRCVTATSRSAPSPTLSAPPQLLRLKSVLLKVLTASPARLGSHLRRIACSAVRRR